VGGIDTGSGLDAAFFTSADGVHWTVTQQQSTSRSQYVAGVVAGHVVRIGNRSLAVGDAVMEAPPLHPDFAPSLWLSDDGFGWTRLHSPSWDAAMQGIGVWRLISGPAGILAVSNRLRDDSIVLHSPDGSRWTQATLPATEHAIATDATAYADGFVVVGRDGQPDIVSEVSDPTDRPPGIGRPAAWTSADGIHWSAAMVEGKEVAGAELSRVVAVQASLVGLAIDRTIGDDPKATLWTSKDGRTWSIAGDAPWPFVGTSDPLFAAEGGRAVVFGRAPEGPGPAAWMTSDGLAWGRLTFADTPGGVGCAEPSCLRLGQAWVVPDGIIVKGSAGDPPVPETFWFVRSGP
jgi:hypothetical protein